LEYHVPVAFTPERPGFKYTNIQNDSSIEDDALASLLPRATIHPSVHRDPLDFASLARSPGTPKKFEDWIYTDAPQLSLHIVSFSDATLVTISWPHTFTDAMGVAALFDAWVLVLNGRESEVLPLHGFDVDPLLEFGTAPQEAFSLASMQLAGLNMALFVVRYLFELIWYPREEGRVVCIPATTLSSIKHEALKNVDATNPFLSDGDVLSAWWTRTVLQNMPWTWNRTIVLMNAFSLRGILSTSLLPGGSSYVSNAATAVYAILPCKEILSKPVAFTASAVHRAIVEQGTKGQMEAYSYAVKVGSPVFGDSSTLMVIISNWTKGKFFDTDFSSAVIREGIQMEKRTNPIGRPSYMHVGSYSEKYPSRNAFPIFGKDAAGNYWLGGRMRAGVWATVEGAIKAL